MYKNYFLLGIRNLKKRWISSTINLVGMSFAFACTTVIFLFINFRYSIDKFHEDKDRTYLITHYPEKDVLNPYGRVPVRVGDLVKSDLGAEVTVSRLVRENGELTVDERQFPQSISFWELSFFEVFSFPVIEGDVGFLDLSDAVISAKLSEKLFGSESAIGKRVSVKCRGRVLQFEIAAVISNPLNSSFKSDLILSFDNLERLSYDKENWSTAASATFIQTSSPSILPLLQESIDKLTEQYNKKNADWPINSWGFVPLSELSLSTHFIKYDIASSVGPPSAVYALIGIGTMLLILACVNFISSGLTSSIQRIKELGLRKTMGSRRRDFFLQYLLENISLFLVAFFASFFISYFLFVPGFNQLLNLSLEWDLSDPMFWLASIAILVCTTCLSTLYPAVFVSSYAPHNILTGRTRFGAKSPWLMGLIMIQLLMAFVSLITGYVFIANEKYVQERDLGYQVDNLLVVETYNPSNYEVLRNNVEGRDEVLSVSGTRDHIGLTNSNMVVSVNKKFHNVIKFEVGDAYLQQLGIKNLSGRWFDDARESDKQAVLISASFAGKLELEDAVGTKIDVGEQEFQIIGIVSDIENQISQEGSEDVIYFMAHPRGIKYLVIKVKPDNTNFMLSLVKDEWQKLNNKNDSNAFFQDELFASYYLWLSSHRKIMIFISIFTVVLASAGLFGLVQFRLESRLKDLSIMKILGASEMKLSLEVINIFKFVLIVVFILGIPSSLYTANLLLNIAYKYHMPVSVQYILYGGVTFLFIVLITVSFHLRRLLTHNPLDSVRTE